MAHGTSMALAIHNEIIELSSLCTNNYASLQLHKRLLVKYVILEQFFLRGGRSFVGCVLLPSKWLPLITTSNDKDTRMMLGSRKQEIYSDDSELADLQIQD